MGSKQVLAVRKECGQTARVRAQPHSRHEEEEESGTGRSPWLAMAFPEAIATVNLKAVAVMMSFDAQGEIRGIHDVFADPPVEKSYLLAKMIARIREPGSPFEVCLRRP